MAMPSSNLEAVTGVVEQVASAGTGIRVGGEWLNYSRNHPDVPRPVRGQRVSVQVDRSERGAWINALEVLDGGAIQFPPRRGSGGRSPAELREIRRLSVLKAAAGFAASRPDMKSGDVLTVADRWLSWVEQPKGGDQPA
jgi:hypothetical protein